MKLWALIGESLKRPRKPMIAMLCAFWIFLNILAQATVAMLSLNYSMDSGTNSTGIFTKHGHVSAAATDCYRIKGGCPSAPGASMITAHSYGELVQGQKNCPFQDDADIHKANQSCNYFSNTNDTYSEFAYRYNEYNPSDVVGAYPFLTDRTIRTYASQCYEYDIDWSRSPVTINTDGDNDLQTFSFYNKTYTGHLPIPVSEGAENSTTYIYNGTSTPQDEKELACGPRCLTMYAYRFAGFAASKIYSCQITVSDVLNTTHGYDWQTVSNDNARLAAASIALTGRYTNPSQVTIWQQYQLHTWGAYWEVGTHDAQFVGANMAQFAIGSLANMAHIIPKLNNLPGTLPILGVHLNNNWDYIISLAICIGVVHVLLVAMILWVSRPIIVLDDSDLSTARLLYGLVGKLGGRGSLLDGKKLAKAIQAKIAQEAQDGVSETANGQVVYGISHGHDLGMQGVLDLGADVKMKKDFKGRRFPPGRYS